MFHDSSDLDQIVDEFDAAWQTGKRPELMAYWKRASEDDRQAAAELLIPIDIEYRSSSGESPSSEDYEFLSVDLSPVNWVLEKSAAFDWPPESSNKKSEWVGPYKLLQKIGEGGMGSVWMADQEKPVRRRVALKLIRTGAGSKETIARFESERQALAMMNHPNIAQVLDAGTTDYGSPFFVMELVRGLSLTNYCDRERATQKERLLIFVDVCRAVHHAHQKGIIHRDLKPSNILVAVRDSKPTPKVIDFGLAKALEQTTQLTDKTVFTEYGKVVGTLQYMAPEQAGMDELGIDTRCDIYSLGAILYELLVGTTPFSMKEHKSQPLLKVLETIRASEPEKPSRRISKSTDAELVRIGEHRNIEAGRIKKMLMGDLDCIVMKAIERDRNRRYDSVNDLAQDIERYLEGEAVEARPSSTRYRMKKFLRKNWQAASIAGIIFASLIAISAILYINLLSTQRYAKQSEQSESRANDAKVQAINAKIEWQQKAEEAENLRAAEKNARLNAEQERTVAIEIKECLADLLRQTSVFEQANRGREASAELTVLQLLKQAADDLSPANLKERFQGRPDIQAELLEIIATSCSVQGLHRTASEYNAAAIRIRQKFGSPHSSKLVVSKCNQVFYSLVARDYISVSTATKDFFDSLENLLDLTEADFPDRPPEFDLDAEINSRLTETCAVLGEKSSPKNIIFPTIDMSVLSPWEVGQIVWNTQGTGPQIRRIRKKMLKRFGPDDLKTIYTSLAAAFHSHGWNEIAIAVRDRAPHWTPRIDVLTLLFSAGSPKIFGPPASYVSNIVNRVRFASVDEPLATYGKLLDRTRRHHPKCHGLIAAFQILIAVTLEKKNGHNIESAELFEKARETLLQSVDKSHPGILPLQGLIGRNYAGAGEYEKAIEVQEDLVSRWPKTFGINHRSTALTKDSLIFSYMQWYEQDTVTEAERKSAIKRVETLTGEVLEWGKSRSLEDHAISFEFYQAEMFRLGRHQTVIDRQADYWNPKFPLIRRTPERFTRPLSLAAASHRELGNRQKEKELLEQLLKMRRSLLGESHVLTRSALVRLAQSEPQPNLAKEWLDQLGSESTRLIVVDGELDDVECVVEELEWLDMKFESREP